MRAIGNWKRITNVRITARDLNGVIIDVVEYENLLPTVGLGMVIDAFQSAAFDSEIKDLALGDDSTAPALTDTTLGNETYRQTITSFSELSSTSLLTTTLIAAADGAGTIEEIGWFAGAGADGVGPDTGILLSRVLYSRVKTVLESLQIERTDTIAEA